jgi:hypothetical protein
MAEETCPTTLTYVPESESFEVAFTIMPFRITEGTYPNGYDPDPANIYVQADFTQTDGAEDDKYLSVIMYAEGSTIDDYTIGIIEQTDSQTYATATTSTYSISPDTPFQWKLVVTGTKIEIFRKNTLGLGEWVSILELDGLAHNYNGGVNVKCHDAVQPTAQFPLLCSASITNNDVQTSGDTSTSESTSLASSAPAKKKLSVWIIVAIVAACVLAVAIAAGSIAISSSRKRMQMRS